MMAYYKLDENNIGDFLKHFEGFDGAVLKYFSYKPNRQLDHYQLTLILDANDSTLLNHGVFGNSTTIEILVCGNVEFCLSEPGGGVNSVINDEIVSYIYNGKLYLNFDPLHSKDWSKENWDVQQIRTSSFYVGGNSISWKIN